MRQKSVTDVSFGPVKRPSIEAWNTPIAVLQSSASVFEQCRRLSLYLLFTLSGNVEVRLLVSLNKYQLKHQMVCYQEKYNVPTKQYQQCSDTTAELPLIIITPWKY